MASIEKIYRELGLTLLPDIGEHMRAHLAAHPQQQFGKHRYSSSPEAVVAEGRRVYRRYQDFGVSNEILK
jgi:hypothetical protein